MNLFFLKALLTPSLIALVSVAGRRWGPTAGGLLVGLPLTSGPVLLILALQSGTAFAADTARGIIFGTISVAFFCLTYAWAALRWRWPGALIASWVVFLVATALLQLVILPLTLAFALCVAVAALALALFPRPSRQRERRSAATTVGYPGADGGRDGIRAAAHGRRAATWPPSHGSTGAIPDLWDGVDHLYPRAGGDGGGAAAVARAAVRPALVRVILYRRRYAYHVGGHCVRVCRGDYRHRDRPGRVAVALRPAQGAALCLTR